MELARENSGRGHVELDVRRSELYVDGTSVKLGARAFELLVALVKADGEIVSKEALLESVWKSRTVEEVSLSVQMSALRKALGSYREQIQTISGRGYRFVGRARERHRADISDAPDHNLPVRRSELIGREQELDQILKQVRARRLTTLVGPGGIGKTRLALEAGWQALSWFPDGVWFVELAQLSDATLLATTVRRALRLRDMDGRDFDAIGSTLAGRNALVVLDNCEHLLEAAAHLVEAILRFAPDVHIMTTSREPLRVDGECSWRVPPLNAPDSSVDDVHALMQSSAVRLFARRLESVFSPREHARLAAMICRRLDGIPLAIELAAGRATSLGIDEVAARLDDCFALLSRGHRTALLRHQTLRATLDWSYDLLTPAEKKAFCRAAVFSGRFFLVDACGIGGEAVVDELTSLVDKSLVTFDPSPGGGSYRLLATTKAYALEKLNADAAEAIAVRRCHAEYFLKILRQNNDRPNLVSTVKSTARQGVYVSEVRTALGWAYSDGRDPSLGVALTIAAVPLWFQLSMFEECLVRVRQAFAELQRLETPELKSEVQLLIALGASLNYGHGPTDETGIVLRKAASLSVGLEDAEIKMQTLWGLWSYHLFRSEHRTALRLAETFCQSASQWADPVYLLVGDRMKGLSLHYKGDQRKAHSLIGRMLKYPLPDASASHIVGRFALNQRVAASTYLSRVSWLQGSSEEALRHAARAVAEAEAADHPMSLYFALSMGQATVALWTGDLGLAARSVEMLVERLPKHRSTLWHGWAVGLEGVVQSRQRGSAEAISKIATSIGVLEELRVTMPQVFLLTCLAEALGTAGRLEEALGVVSQAIRCCQRHQEYWCIAELLRLKGEFLMRQGAPPGLPERAFRRALYWARVQGADAWEQRICRSLSEHKLPVGRRLAELAN